jgi:hypothetical protein
MKEEGGRMKRDEPTIGFILHPLAGGRLIRSLSAFIL